MSYELVASVVGLSNNYKEQYGTRPGVGKSCLCFRLAYPEFDSYVDTHPSLFALHEFESRAVNSNHFIYWGSPVKFFPVKGGDCKIKFHIIEQTVFYQDVTALPFNHSMMKPDNVDSYVKRIVGPIESRGKVSYHSRDALVTGMPPGHMVVNYPSGITRLPRGFIVVFDVSVNGKALEMQYKRVDPILSYLNKHKKKFIIAVTKRDKYSMPSLEMAYELRKKYRTHLVECSALDDLNTEEVLRVLALIIITKKTSGLSDHVMRYHDAAQHVLLRRTSAKSGFKSYVRKKVLNSDERLPSVQKSEEFKECARWIGSHKTGCIFALHVLELYNTKIEESYAGVREDEDMHFEYLEDFVDQRKDIEPYKDEMRRWISTYVNEFSHEVQAFEQHKVSTQIPTSGDEAGSSVTIAEANTINQMGEAISTAVPSNDSPVAPRIAPSHTPGKPTQASEGYHIFESVSKVNKESSKQEAVNKETAETDLSKEESGSGGSTGENAKEENSHRKESGPHDVGKEEDNEEEEDAVSTYSSDSMESVSDHDYLNFDPKAIGEWTAVEGDNSSSLQGGTAKEVPSSSVLLTAPNQRSSIGKSNDDLSDVDYENMQDFVEDYVNTIESSSDRPSNQGSGGFVDDVMATKDDKTDEHLPATNSEATKTSRIDEEDFKDSADMSRRSEAEHGESSAADVKEITSAAPQVSPKPSVKKRTQGAQLPPLIVPVSSSRPSNPIVFSEPSPTHSSGSSSPSTSERMSSSLMKPKPATPIRQSSLNYKSPPASVTSLKGSGTPPATHCSSPNTVQQANNPKSEKPVSRSTSIRQRAKLLELSMTSSSVSQESEVLVETQKDSTTDENSSQCSTKEVTEFHSKPPLPMLQEALHHVEMQVLELDVSLSSTPLDQTNASGSGVRIGGDADTSNHLDQQTNSLATMRSPAATTSLPTTSLHLASPMSQPPQDSRTSTSGGQEKRPRLSKIKHKLAQKKGVETEEEKNSETSEAGSIDEVFSPTSAAPTDRPSLAKIRQKIRGSSSTDGDAGVPQGELVGVLPSNSINLPPIPPKPSSTSSMLKRASAPATQISQNIDPDRLKEWNRQTNRAKERVNSLEDGAPPPLPVRTTDMFKLEYELSRERPARAHPRDYLNVEKKDKQLATSKPVTADSTSTAIPKPEETAKVSPTKKVGVTAKKAFSKKDETAKGKERVSPLKKVSSKKAEEGTKQKEHTSPIKKVLSPVKYPFQKIKSKNPAGSKETEPPEVQTKAKFVVMATRPLPSPPCFHQSPHAIPAHTDDDYEDFAFDSIPVEYMNYPQLPPEAVGGNSSKLQRSQSQKPEKTTRSAPVTPLLQGKFNTMGVRSGRPVPRPVLSDQQYDSDGYVNASDLPEVSSADSFRNRPLPSRPPPAVNSKKNDDLDYDYPDLRLAGAFNNPKSMKAAMVKYEMSVIKSRQPQKGSYGDRAEDQLKASIGFDNDDDQFRDRTCSDASSAYVPMDGWYDQENPYVNTDVPVPHTVDVEQSLLLPPRTQNLKSASDHNIAAGIGREGTEEGEDEFGKVYMNLPAPEKFSTLPPRPSSTRFQNPAGSTISPAQRVRGSNKSRSLDDSHTIQYPTTRTKVRSATVAAEPPAGLQLPFPREAWNKTASREAEGNRSRMDSLPPRNIPRTK